MKTRQTIISAAAEVFDEFGYNGASMRQIMQRAGVTLGAVYFHFPNKEELARTVMNSQPGTVVPRLTSQGLQRVVDMTLVWSCQLQRDPILRAGVRLGVEQVGFGLRETASYEAWEHLIEDCFVGAQEFGELREHVVPRSLAEFVVGACTGVQLYSDLVCQRADLPARIVEMWKVLLPGIADDSTVQRIDASVQRATDLVA
ncbi:TetR family transcriptional regulator [Streptomyces cahuitamycinicus]|uniref:TetR family transcriptional regulator n=1 Tax=Streptomyces cahuitamycinicus TaxID=2070367 RepID=A0A2N8TX01_9ACTN|nr:TetR family transcriptional regulator [Streptomyces cahuitamycinicus]